MDITIVHTLIILYLCEDALFLQVFSKIAFITGIPTSALDIARGEVKPIGKDHTRRKVQKGRHLVQRILLRTVR